MPCSWAGGGFKCWVTRPGSMGQLAQLPSWPDTPGWCWNMGPVNAEKSLGGNRLLQEPTVSHSTKPRVYAHSFPWRQRGPSYGLLFPQVKALSFVPCRESPCQTPSPPNHRFSSISAAAEPCGGRQYPNCFPSNNLSRTTAANLKRRFSDRSFGRWGALCRDPWTVWICFLKLLWDGCHLWKRFLMSKAKI